MNLVLLSFIALLLLCVLVGYKRGFIKSVLSFAGIVVAIILANVFYPYVDSFMSEKTPARKMVKQRVEKFVEKIDVGEDINLEAGLDVYDKELFIEDLEIPDVVKDYIRSNEKNNNNSGKKLKDYKAYIIDYMTSMVLKGISYMVAIVVAVIILLIAFSISGILTDIPIVKGIDKTGGIVFGAVQAVLFMWIFMVLITLMSASDWAGELMKNIEDSTILSFIYKKNYLMKIIVDILENI